MQPESNELLSGLLMVDRPRPADPEWLAEVEAIFAGAPTQAGLQPALGRGGAGLDLAQAFGNRSERLKRAVRGVKDRRSHAEGSGAVHRAQENEPACSPTCTLR